MVVLSSQGSNVYQSIPETSVEGELLNINTNQAGFTDSVAKACDL